MANGSRHRRARPRRPGTWAWWLFATLLLGTAGFFWLLSNDLRLQRAIENPGKETAQNRSRR